MCVMLQAGDSSLPRHRQACVAVSRRPRAPAPPPGLTDPSRTAGLAPKISTFCSKTNSTFCMRACAWPRLPTIPQARAAPNQLAALLNYRCSSPAPPQQLHLTALLQPISQAPPPRVTSSPPPRHSSRVRAWERIDAALPPRHHTHLRAAALLQRSAPASPQRFVL